MWHALPHVAQGFRQSLALRIEQGWRALLCVARLSAVIGSSQWQEVRQIDLVRHEAPDGHCHYGLLRGVAFNLVHRNDFCSHLRYGCLGVWH